VYFANIESDAPMVHPRHWTLAPLMVASEWLYAAAFWCAGTINPMFQPTWPLRVTGTVGDAHDA
jgi:hypothetical protein